MNNLYLLLDAITFGLPFLLSFDKKVAFYKNWRYLFPAIIVSGAIFIIWDIWFAEFGIWGFNPEYLTGISMWGLPVEEWLFFFVVPYACLFIYECMIAYVPGGLFERDGTRISAWMGGLLTLVGAMFYDQLYTSITFIGCGLYLLYLGPLYHRAFLGRFFQSYLVVLVPFLVVNGILTGTGIEDEVVWYNPSHIFGVRIHTIPVEDVIYGMFLLLLTTHVYEWLKSRSRNA